MPLPFLLEEGVSLASLTTLGVGGPARYLVRCRDVKELDQGRRWARAMGLPVFVLGGGSNLLAADAGFDGLVIQLIDEVLVLETCGECVRFKAGAGVDWDSLVARTVHERLGGLECLSGIPGRVGAAPMQNIGAYGQEVAETIEAVRVVELATGEVQRLIGDECGFGYRTSHFKQAWRGRYVVTGVDFLLRPCLHGTVRYADLRRRFGMQARGGAPTLAEVRDGVLEIRRDKSMIIDRQDPNHRSVGSFFTNPIVRSEVAEEISRATEREMPAFPTVGGRVKLSAAWLIEEAGFNRGERLGRAGLSTRHVLALVNHGGATADEIVALAAKIRRRVREVFAVTLSPEPVFLGFEQGIETLLD